MPTPSTAAPAHPPSTRERLLLGVQLLTLYAAIGLGLRLVLYASFHEAHASPPELAGIAMIGLLRDVPTGVLLLAPIFLGLALLRCGWLARPFPRTSFLTLVCGLLLFQAAVEYFFFEEFDARFNNIAIDYVLFPREVAGNVWQSYDVPLVLALAGLAGLGLALLLGRGLRRARFAALPWLPRLAGCALVFGLAGGSISLLWALPREVVRDRVSNEIAANGYEQLVRALWSADLSFPLYYRSLPAQQELERGAAVLGFGAPAAWSDAAGLPCAPQKRVHPEPSVRAPRQIVIVLEESLGSDFVAGLGGRYDCAPELDRHASDGLLLTNLIANGNRTVRGLEGVLCSFIPLPGYAVLQRGRSENMATVARVLGAQGYETAFFYGGSGLFDRIRPFVEQNGWDEFMEESDFPEDCFRTIWGVADEYVFDALLARQEAARADDRPLFATMLSVSNHKPYAYPVARFPQLPPPSGRREAVRYADACIGEYLDQLEQRGLRSETLVLIVGDHGARVYGSEDIPIRSYRIPALFLTPDSRWRGQRLERLCSQIDLVPTLLALAGIEYTAPFLGTSLLDLPPEGGRAFVHHNRDVGLLTDQALAVLGLQKSVRFYARSGRASDEFTPVPSAEATPAQWSLADDASAAFGLAFRLYQERLYRLPSDTPLRTARVAASSAPAF